MARKLAVSTQLKEATKKVDELEKALKQKAEHVAMYQKSAATAEEMIEQMHQVLDAVPNSIPRESEGENSWSKVKRSPVTRMAAWLAGIGAHRP